MRIEPTGLLNPDVVGAVDHQLGYFRVFQDAFKPREKRFEVLDSTGPAHIRPSSRRRQ